MRVKQTAPNTHRRKAREGKTVVGAFLDKADVLTIHHLLARLALQRGRRMTLQEFVDTAIARECRRHGVKLAGKS
jgi:hypothetical protein